MTKEDFKKFRTKAGITQLELAYRLGVTPVHISRLENGHVEIPKLVELAMKTLPENG